MTTQNQNWDGGERRQETLASQALVAQLAILNERLGNLLDTFTKHVEADDKKFEAHDKRLSSIEGFQMKVVGGLAVVSILIQLVFNFHKSVEQGSAQWQQTQYRQTTTQTNLPNQ